MGFLSTIGLSSSDQDKRAAQARKANLAAAKKKESATSKGYAQGTKAIKSGIEDATGALAPSILSAGDYLSNQNLGRDVSLSAYGITDPGLASEAFNRSLSPLRERAFQDILRKNVNAGIVGGGGTQTDIADYISQNEYDPWRREITSAFDPYNAISLQGTLGGRQADIYTGGATNLSNLATGKASALSNIFGEQGQANANYFNTLAANQGQVGQNILGLAGNILGAGATLAGMRVPGAGAAGAAAAPMQTAAAYGPKLPTFGNIAMG